MASISSPGLGSGLDVTSLVSQLMAVERRPLTALNSREAAFQAKISALGSLRGALSQVETAAAKLKAGGFTDFKGSVGDSSVASVTVSSIAPAGSYSLEVTQLAQAQIVSTGQDPATTNGLLNTSGSINIQLGSNTAVTVSVTAGQTLGDLAATINADANLKTQIKASVVDRRLVLESRSTGAANTITVSNATAGLQDFQSTTVARPALDANFKLNGLSIVRSTNTVGDALTGVTINLLKTNTGSTTPLTVARNSGAVKSALEGFIKAYNETNTTIRDLGLVNSATGEGSILTGDATLRTAQSQLRALIGTPPAGLVDPFANNLSQLGVSVARDGSLSLDSGKLQTLFDERPESVDALVKAFGASAQSITKSLSSEGGLVASRIEGMSASISTLDLRREALNRRLEQIEARYRRQFTALDSTVSSLQNTSTFLTQQLANLPKIGG